MMRKFALFTLLTLLFPQVLFAKLSSDPNVQQWGYTDVKAYGAWDYSTGSRDVIVAVIDNGFDTFHPDLRDNVWKNTKEIENNNIDDDSNGYIDDVWGWNFVPEDKNNDGLIDATERKGNNNPQPKVSALTEQEKMQGVFHHATVVAGIIGGVGDNAVAGVGINWKVQLMNVKVIDNTGSGDLVLLAPAIRYAVDNGASVINISMVGNFIQTDLLEAIRYAHQKGVVLVAAVGNDSKLLDQSPRYPACADSFESEQMVLGVSGIDETHHLTSFSNYGSRCVDIAAPGLHILSTLRYDPSAGLSNLYGGLWNGTSFAAPFVSGAAALVKAIQPTWKANEIMSTLLGTVHKTPPSDEVVYAHLFGKGLLQIDKAVMAAQSGVVPSVAPAPTPVAPPTITLPPAQPTPEPTPLPTPVPVPMPPSVTESLGVLIFNDTDAKGQIYNYSEAGLGSPFSEQQMIFLQGLESLSRYKNGNTESRYGVLYFRKDGYSIVRLYNKKFERLGGFRKLLSFPSTLVLADVTGDAEPEIILSPKVADTLLYSVYDKDGKELFSVKAKEKHTGVSVARKFTSNAGKDTVAVMYKQGNRVFLDEYRETGILSGQRELSAKTELGGLFYGDVNGDGSGEYAAIIIAENTLWVRYYDTAGRFLKRIPVFQFVSKEQKVNVTFDDFDSDGKFEVVATEKFGGRGVYGVFGIGDSSKLLITLKNESKNNYFVVPYVK